MSNPSLEIRQGQLSDLDDINRVIEAAVMNWPMAERVKRLSLSTLKYDAVDLEHLDVYVSVYRDEILGVATLDRGHVRDGDQGLLHGLYVLPIAQRQGIGSALMQKIFEYAQETDLTSVAIRAERVSAGYFQHKRLEPIEPANDAEYPYRFEKRLAPAA